MIGFGITSQMEVLVIGESLNVKSAVKSLKNFLGSMAYNSQINATKTQHYEKQLFA
jgi:hypothetical protein